MKADFPIDAATHAAPACEPVVDVHLMDMDRDVSAYARFAAMLSPEEHDWAGRLHRSLDRRRYMVRRGRLRELLACRLDCDPRDVPITCNAFGKPRVEGTELRFNLSRSRGTALFTFTQGREIGCDIEWQDPRAATMEVAQRFFTRNEFETLRSLPDSQRTEGFFNCWTRKEAFVKARGGGLSLPLDAFAVSLAPSDAPDFTSGGAGWSIQAFRPHERLHAAIVVETV
jgi:4'-phosphopantetheinyl transferase